MGSVKLSTTLSAVILALGVSGAAETFAGPREQAKRIHDRLTGVQPSTAVLNAMEGLVAAGNPVGAATLAMDNPAFYNTTVKDFATPWFNRDGNVFAELNDSVATVVGMVRDDVPFDQVLYGDIVYTGANGVVNAAYSPANNDHYQQLEADRVDLQANLVQSTQSELSAQLGSNETAGVMTTRGFAEAFLIDGTNRAATRFAFVNFMCVDMEDIRDITRGSDWVRQDVDRSPGGDSAIYLNDCLSCHAGLDPLSGSLAYYDFDEELAELVYTGGEVDPKYARDAGVFPAGFVTNNDAWENRWRNGPNAYLGWSVNLPGSGTGAKSMGQELAGSRAFAECQVKKAMAKVCHRDPSGTADMTQVRAIADSFQASNYSMKQVFAESAAYCMGN